MLNCDLDDACTGMILGQDVVGAKGQLLLRAGATLTDSDLQVLRVNNVRRILVGQSRTATAGKSGAEKIATDLEAHIAERFRICDTHHPLIRELRRLYRNRLTQDQTEEGPDDD